MKKMEITDTTLFKRKAEGQLKNKTEKLTKGLTKKEIDLLWSRMIDAYGHAWGSNFGIAPNKMWIDGLRTVTPEQVGHGLSVLIRTAPKYPPSVFQFLAMCKEGNNKKISEKKGITESELKKLRKRTEIPARDNIKKMYGIINLK